MNVFVVSSESPDNSAILSVHATEEDANNAVTQYATEINDQAYFVDEVPMSNTNWNI